MNKDLLLAIDVGTGSARAALVAETGKILAFAAKEYDQIVPHFGWSQQNPRTWWQGVAFGIRSVISEVAHGADRIAGIAACGQMHATVLIDEAGELAFKRLDLRSQDERARVDDRYQATQVPQLQIHD